MKRRLHDWTADESRIARCRRCGLYRRFVSGKRYGRITVYTTRMATFTAKMPNCVPR